MSTIIREIKRVLPKGRYVFFMIDHKTHKIALEKTFFTKVFALNCLRFHAQLSHLFSYRLIDTKTKKEIDTNGFTN